MKLVKPYVKIVESNNDYEHICKAARICYASETEVKDNFVFCESLWHKGHRSPFRHGTIYLEISASFERLLSNFIHSPYCACVFIEEEYSWFISTNYQYIREIDIKTRKTIQNFFISYGYLLDEIKKYPQLKDIIRVSFEIQTQVSTSRELNRVSPNNICEQSTRFCNFTNEKKFGKHIAFCQPHWLNAIIYYDTESNKQYDAEERIFYNQYIGEDCDTVALVGNAELPLLQEYPLGINGIDKVDGSALIYSGEIAKTYIEGLIDDEERYFKMTKLGMRPEDARGILGLDVATKCFYTYSIKEWKHILDLRYKGTTGKPHANAKIIAEQIYNKLKELDLLYDYE